MQPEINLFLDQCRQFNNEEVINIKKALTIAAHAHKGQKRKTGEEYISHPIGVARVLLRFNHPLTDSQTVIAALLHDTVEDTSTTNKQIESMFGQEVAELVEVLTDDKLIESKSKNDSEYQNKIQNSQNKKAWLIKLADVLHNHQTNHVHSIERQKQKIQQIKTFYANIASELNLYSIADQLKNIKFVEPSENH